MAGLVSWVEAAGALRGAGPALANHLWQSTAFAAVAAGLTLALKQNNARARYWIWMSASIKLLLPFALLAGLASHWVKPRAAAPVDARMYSAVEDVSEPFSPPPAPAVKPRYVVVRGGPAGLRQLKTIAPHDAAAPTQAAHRTGWEDGLLHRAIAALPLVLASVWLAGFAAAMGTWLVRWWRVSRTIRNAVPLTEGREVAALRRTELAAGVRRPIELRASASAMEPGVFGILRPVLALPAAISDRLDDAQLEAILAHEVCHVRRRDNLTAALHMLVEAAFWFHPMVWWMGARLVEERERACDEEVLLLGRQPEVYAESILKVCEFCVQSPLECVSGVTGADLKQRVLEIMTRRTALKLTWGKKLLLAAVATLVAAVPIVLGQAKATRRLQAIVLAPKPIRVMLTAVGTPEKKLDDPKTHTPQPGILSALADAASGSLQRMATAAAALPSRSQERPGSQDNTNADHILTAQDASNPSGTAPAPPPQVFHFPQATLSSRGKKADGPGIIDLPQPGFGAEITLASHGATDWLQNVQVISRSVQNIVSVRMGWAYVLPSGALEFHQRDVETVHGGAGTNTNFQLGSQGAAVRTDVKDFIAFVEQVTLKDGTVLNADHGQITTAYKSIAEGKAVAGSKPDIDPNSTAAQQAGRGPHLTAGLKPISFDVVSFRRTERQGSTRVDLPVEGDYIAYHGVPIERLILFAHIARKGYVSLTGEPEWAKTDPYEFTAKVAPEDVAEWKQMSLTDKRAMVATLLADALKLKVHQNTEPQPVYDLIVAKTGPKLTEYQPGDTVKAPGGQVLTGKVLMWFDPFTLVCQDTTIAELVNSLSGPNRAGRVVVDKTGLNGAYNFTVPIPYAPLPQQIQEMSDTPSTYEGLKKLGLQMVKSTGVIDEIVVDHVERPAEN